jgi:pyruvate dehydrogenase E1 component alpha subunit
MAVAVASLDLVAAYRTMWLIRAFEDRIQELFVQGEVSGTTHLCQGQEAVSVGVAAALRRDDYMTCTYRGHGHVLAKGADPTASLAEILGRANGLCRGLGGSMHLADASCGALGSFAIVGAGLPIAVGAAWSARLRGTDQVAVAFFGDGTVNIGAFHEALNLAAVWTLPVLFVCENNLYGEYTPFRQTSPVSQVVDRAPAYGLPAAAVDGNDVEAVFAAARQAVARARKGEGPTLLECKTYRQRGHSRTDPATYRPRAEVEHWLSRDPIHLLRERLLSAGLLDEQGAERVAAEAQETIAAAEAAARADRVLPAEEVESYVYA